MPRYDLNIAIFDAIRYIVQSLEKCTPKKHSTPFSSKQTLIFSPFYPAATYPRYTQNTGTVPKTKGFPNPIPVLAQA